MAMEKPQLRGLAVKTYTKVLYISLALGCLTGVYLKYNLLEARKKEYADFHKNYDIEKEYQAIKASGVYKGFENPN